MNLLAFPDSCKSPVLYNVLSYLCRPGFTYHASMVTTLPTSMCTVPYDDRVGIYSSVFTETADFQFSRTDDNIQPGKLKLQNST
jgi:hypothetical protein